MCNVCTVFVTCDFWVWILVGVGEIERGRRGMRSVVKYTEPLVILISYIHPRAHVLVISYYRPFFILLIWGVISVVGPVNVTQY